MAGPGCAAQPPAARPSPDPPAEGGRTGGSFPSPVSPLSDPPAPQDQPRTTLPLLRDGSALAVELSGLGAGGAVEGTLELRGRRVRCVLRTAGAPGRARLARASAELATGLARLGLALEELEVSP